LTAYLIIMTRNLLSLITHIHYKCKVNINHLDIFIIFFVCIARLNMPFIPSSFLLYSFYAGSFISLCPSVGLRSIITFFVLWALCSEPWALFTALSVRVTTTFWNALTELLLPWSKAWTDVRLDLLLDLLRFLGDYWELLADTFFDGSLFFYFLLVVLLLSLIPNILMVGCWMMLCFNSASLWVCFCW
jgi:hypothetical protein